MSDIGSGSVSWRDGNEPKDKAVLRGEPFRKYAVEAILQDLIAELREADEMGEEGLYVIGPAADRAEQRLRELQSE